MELKKTTAVVFGTAVLALSAAPAMAGQDTPGTPGDSNCVGQTNAYLAQFAKDAGFPGLGNVAAAYGLTVKEVQAIVRAYCAQ